MKHSLQGPDQQYIC